MKSGRMPLAVTLVICALLFTGGCARLWQPFRRPSAAGQMAPAYTPATIPEQSVPRSFRESVYGLVFSNSTGPQDVKWHVYRQASAYAWSAGTFTAEVSPGKRSRLYMLEVQSRGQLLGAFMAEFREAAFYGSPGYGYNEVGGKPVYDLVGTGVALDKAVRRIIGTTASGKTIEGQLENAFWVVVLPNAPDNDSWADISALDETGKVLYHLE